MSRSKIDNIKYMVRLTFILIAMFLFSIAIASAQNLDSLPQSKRDSILIAMSKAIILKHGPGYYREYKKPIIERKVCEEHPLMEEKDRALIGKAFYCMTYLYDKSKERLDEDFAAKVFIWATGEPHSVWFGNRWGVSLDLPETRSNKKVTVIPYDPVVEGEI